MLHRDHVLAGVLDQQVVVVQQLHLPHAQQTVLVEVLEEPSQGQLVATALGLLEEIHEQSVLQTVYRDLPERRFSCICTSRCRWCCVWSPCVSRGHLFAATEPTNCAQQREPSALHGENVDALVLHGEHTQRVIVQVQSLVVRQENLVHFVVVVVGEATLQHVHDVQRVLFQGTTLRGRQ